MAFQLLAATFSALGLATATNQIEQNTAIPDNISTTGAPLLVAPNLLYSAMNKTVAAGGGQLSSGGLAFNQPAFDILVEAEIAASATAPWLQLQLTWIDSNTSFEVCQENFYMAVTQNGPNLIGGRGQTKADTLEVTLVNQDPAKIVTVGAVSVVQHSRIPPFTEFRQIAFNGIGSGTPLQTPPSDPDSNVLISTDVSIGNGANITYILPMYTGKVRFSYAEVAQAGRFVVRNPGAENGASLVNSFTFDSGPIAASTAFSSEVALPRANLELEIINSGTAAASFILVATIEDY